MNLYIDLENIERLVDSRNHFLYEDCMKTMRKQLNIYFNFKKSELLKNEKLLAWFKLFSEGVNASNRQEFSSITFPERPLKSNSYVTFDFQKLSSIYLLNDNKIELLKSKGAILIGAPGEEMDLFSFLFFHQGDYLFEKKLRINGPDFTKWEDLQVYTANLTEIIIVDSYILADSDLIEPNLIAFLKTLCSKSRCKLNIVLYTHHDQVSIPYNELSKMIRTSIQSITGISPNFTLIKYRDQKGQNVAAAEHDRTIITNYMRIYSGDSFKYFTRTGRKVTKGREIHFSSFANTENFELAVDLLNDLETNISSLPAEFIEGDRKSNFIQFQQ